MDFVDIFCFELGLGWVVGCTGFFCGAIHLFFDRRSKERIALGEALQELLRLYLAKFFAYRFDKIWVECHFGHGVDDKDFLPCWVVVNEPSLYEFVERRF